MLNIYQLSKMSSKSETQTCSDTVMKNVAAADLDLGMTTASICGTCKARYSFSGKFESLLTSLYEDRCCPLNSSSTLTERMDISCETGEKSNAVKLEQMFTNSGSKLSDNCAIEIKKEHCSICLGVLDPSFMIRLAQLAVENLLKEEFDCREYFPTFCLPVSCLVRESFLSHQFRLNDKKDELFDASDAKNGIMNKHLLLSTDDNVSKTACYGLKEACKMIILRLLLKLLPDNWKYCPTVTCANGKMMEQDRVEIMFWLSHSQEDQDCSLLAKLIPSRFNSSNCPRGKRAHNAEKSKPDSRTLFNRTSVKAALGMIEKSHEILCKIGAIQFAPVIAGCSHLIQFARPPVHVAGRYCKYNRAMFQSYWSKMDEEAVGEMNTIEGLIAKPWSEYVRASETTFSASGREDMDVRMLGSGRPFVVSLYSPRLKFLTNHELAKMQLKINKSTGDIQIRDLQLVDEKDLSILKQGEDSKVKHYVAQIVCTDDFNQSVIDQKLVDMINDRNVTCDSPLVLQQKTPLRVLHRRPNCIRPKSIYCLRADLIDARSFMLQLSTQAGTYVKEFVHGDLGRTRPSLRSMTGLEGLQIVELDVAGVDLDWPPPVEEKP